MQKWEYKVILRQIIKTVGAEESFLNGLGEEGWELVSVDRSFLFLKRLKSN